jgi:hypothetical protein
LALADTGQLGSRPARGITLPASGGAAVRYATSSTSPCPSTSHPSVLPRSSR